MTAFYYIEVLNGCLIKTIFWPKNYKESIYYIKFVKSPTYSTPAAYFSAPPSFLILATILLDYENFRASRTHPLKLRIHPFHLKLDGFAQFDSPPPTTNSFIY